jgi:EmrB/QacA subfamily drug resistance transporter
MVDTMTSPPSALPRHRRALALAVLLSGSFVTLLDTMIAHVAVPSITRDLHAPIADLELIIAGYGMSYGILLVTGGRLGDLFGRRRLFLLGMTAFTIASLLCGLAPTSRLLVLARILQGATAAMMFPQVFSIIRVTYVDDAERRAAFGWMGLVLGLAAISGQLIGGFLIDADIAGLGWRVVFLVNLPIGILSVLAGILVLPKSRDAGRSGLDLIGVALATLALSLLIVPLVEGQELGWPAWTLISLLLCLPAFAAFVIHETRLESRGGYPIFAMRLTANSGFVLGIIAVLVFYSTANSLFLSIALFLQRGLNFSPSLSGLTFTPAAIAFSVASLRAPRLVARYGRLALQGGGLIYAAGMALMALQGAFWPQDITPVTLAPGMVLFGFGQGLLTTQLLGSALGAVTVDDAGMASGAISTMQQIGNCLGVALVGLIFFGILHASAAGLPSNETYGAAFAAAMIYNVIGALVTVVIVRYLPRFTPSF